MKNYKGVFKTDDQTESSYFHDWVKNWANPFNSLKILIKCTLKYVCGVKVNIYI